MLVDCWSRERAVAWRLALSALLCALPWLIYATLVFGSPLPTTLAAKTAQTTLGWWAQQPAYPIAALRSLPAWPLTLACLIACSVPMPRSLLGRGPALVLAFGVTQTAIYAAIGAPSGYRWYYAPLALSGVIAGVVAARHLSERSRWVAGPALIVLAISCFELATSSRSYRHSIAYREVAHAIAAHSSPHDRVAAAEIGYLGYASRRPIVDLHGLIHPRAGDAIARGRSDWWKELEPRFVVTHEPSWYAEPELGGTEPYDLFASFREPNGSAVEVWVRRVSATP
jgi:hypothetical protein